MTLIKRILVPVDLSEASRAALEVAGEMATLFDAKLDVLYALEELEFMPQRPEIVLDDGRRVDLVEYTKTRAESELSAFLASSPSVRVEQRWILSGAPSKRIVEKADAEHYDLIAMGKHGHSRLERLFLGSVTERVLRRSSCPVLVIPAPLEEAFEAA